MQEEKIIECESKEEQISYMEEVVKEQRNEKPMNHYYEESIEALTQYIRNNETNPSEKCWNHYAIHEKYLSSKTIGYLSGMGFNTLCRKKRKQINKEKREKERNR